MPRHRIPKSRVEWWTAKINRNRERDVEVREALAAAGWTVMVLWECEIENPDKIEKLIADIRTAPRMARA